MLNYVAEPVDVALLSQVARALGHPKRIAILNALIQGVQCNCEISAQLGLADNLISHHMRILEETGLVQSQRDPDDARWIYYTVNLHALVSLQAALCSFFDVSRVQPRLAGCGPSAGRGCGPGSEKPCD